MHAPIVAVDGTAGSGKSSVCRGVAARLGLHYLDTGAMYRAMTWSVLAAGVDVEDPHAVGAHVAGVELVSGTDPSRPSIHADGVDVTVAVRGEAVTAAVSAVSAVPAVRERLTGLQRRAVASAHEAGRGIVVEGRDIGTVVLPNADLKVFVTADPAVRAARRAAQDAELGRDGVDVAVIEAELRARDAKDASRAHSPLAKAGDAVVVDTSDLTLDATIDAVATLIADLPDQR